jgi:hypothetical protein
VYSGKSSVALLLACLFLTLGLTAGCGGADQSSENQNGNDNSGASQGQTDTPQQQAGETAQGAAGGATDQAAGSAPEIKIALGDILSVDAERRRLVLKPVEGERQVFRVAPNADVTLDDSPTDLSSLEQGQQAQLRYIAKNDRFRARSVNAFSVDGATQ